MTNKFKYSVTAALLAAAMVLSSQGVVAFADRNDESVATDSSPVQEMVIEQPTTEPPAESGESEKKEITPEKPVNNTMINKENLPANDTLLSPLANNEDKPTKAALTVSINGTFYNPNTRKHEHFTNLNVTTTVKVAHGTNPSFPVSYRFEKNTYYRGSPSDPHWGKSGYELIISIGDQDLNTANAWVFNRDLSNERGTGQVFRPIWTPSLSSNYRNTLRISYWGAPEIPDPGDPTQPNPPTVNSLPKNIVKIDCVNTEINPEHQDGLYDAIEGTVTIGKVYEKSRSADAAILDETAKAGTEYRVDVTFNNSAPYVDKYNKQLSAEHTRTDTPDTRKVTFRYDDSLKAWLAVDKTPVVYEVICETLDNRPEPPTINDLPKNIVKIDCVNAEINPEHQDGLYDTIEGTVTIGTVYENTRSSEIATLEETEETEKTAKEYLVDVTFNNSKPYVDEYNKTQDVEHIRNDQNETRKVTFKYDSSNSQWLPVDPTPIVYDVICQYPDEPTLEEIKVILGEAVKLDCVNTEIKPPHPDKVFELKDNTFEVGSVFVNDMSTPLADNRNFAPFYVNVTINDPQPYIDEYSTQIGTKHVLNYNELETKTITLEYDDSQTPAKWVVNDESMVPVTYQIICETPEKPVDPTDPTDPTDPGTNPGGNTGNNDDDDDEPEISNFPSINLPGKNTPTIDDEDVPLTDLPDDTVTIDDGEVPLKDNPETGDAFPVAALAAAALSLGGVVVLNRKKK